MILQPVTGTSASLTDLQSAVCTSDTLVGDMVYISGERVQAGVYKVGRCDIDAEYKRPIGMVIYKDASTSCLIQLSGVIESLYTGMTPGRYLFLGVGEGARLTHTPPTSVGSGYTRYQQIAGMAMASDVLVLNILGPDILH